MGSDLLLEVEIGFELENSGIALKIDEGEGNANLVESHMLKDVFVVGILEIDAVLVELGLLRFSSFADRE